MRLDCEYFRASEFHKWEATTHEFFTEAERMLRHCSNGELHELADILERFWSNLHEHAQTTDEWTEFAAVENLKRSAGGLLNSLVNALDETSYR